MKNKINKKVLIISIFVLFIILSNIVIIISNKTSTEKNTKDNTIKKRSAEINQMTCTFTDKDEIHYTVNLYFEANILKTKTEETTWNNKDTATCTFYKKRIEVYNSITGINDTVNCDSSSGIRNTTFDIATLDKKEANIIELKYITGDNTFDFDGYRINRENKGYHCEIK